jgi:hypothetical protein
MQHESRDAFIARHATIELVFDYVRRMCDRERIPVLNISGESLSNPQTVLDFDEFIGALPMTMHGSILR